MGGFEETKNKPDPKIGLLSGFKAVSKFDRRPLDHANLNKYVFKRSDFVTFLRDMREVYHHGSRRAIRTTELSRVIDQMVLIGFPKTWESLQDRGPALSSLEVARQATPCI